MCWLTVIMTRVVPQIVFAGVFLLTRASQPGGAAAGQTEELQPLGSKARVAYVGDEDAQPLAPAGEAASDSRKWQLSAVRSAQSGEQLLLVLQLTFCPAGHVCQASTTRATKCGHTLRGKAAWVTLAPDQCNAVVLA